MADVTKVKASDGTIYDINDVNDYTKDETDALLAGKADVGVSYTKAEDDALLAAKADSSNVDSALALKANVVDVYSKTEADNLLAGKAAVGDSYTKAEDDALLAAKADASTTYTKTEVDNALALKADASTTYTKTEVDTALALKADDADVYDKTEVYTKAEVDALIGGVKMFPNLDWANPVHTFTTSDRSYTAVEDCYLTGIIQFNSSIGVTDGIYINGVRVYGAENYNVSSVIPITLIKAGVTVEVRGSVLNSWTALNIFKEVTV